MGERRTVVVTGGASGIGRATAKRFGRAGDEVVVADINPETAAKVVGEIQAAGGEARFHAVDVAEEASVAALAEAASGATVLVNSAGLLQNISEIESLDMEEHDRLWAVNYRGTLLAARAFARAMAAAGGGGNIVNISSTSAVAAFPLHSYGPGKAAIDRLTAILASDLGPKGIRVNAVMPGYVLTEQMKARIASGHRDATMMERQSSLGRMVEPAEIADAIHFLCSDAARVITGISLPVDAGWLAHVTYRQHPGFSGTN